MEKIGECGVDSGQLMIVDPCYLKDWKDNEFKLEREYIDKKGKIISYGKDFNNYESKLSQYKNKTVNKLIEEGILKELSIKKTGEFSYDGVCRETCSEKSSGCIKNGIATVFASGYGDGVYPIYAKRNKEGRIIQVIIDMLDEEITEEE